MDTAGYQHVLEEMVAHLRRTARRDAEEGASDGVDPAEPRDDGDESVWTQARDERYLFGERDARLALACEEALGRIARGEYGRCIDCDSEIEPARLAAVPWARRCVADEEALELEQRVTRAPTL